MEKLVCSELTTAGTIWYHQTPGELIQVWPAGKKATTLICTTEWRPEQSGEASCRPLVPRGWFSLRINWVDSTLAIYSNIMQCLMESRMILEIFNFLSPLIIFAVLQYIILKSSFFILRFWVSIKVSNPAPQRASERRATFLPPAWFPRSLPCSLYLPHSGKPKFLPRSQFANLSDPGKNGVWLQCRGESRSSAARQHPCHTSV